MLSIATGVLLSIGVLLLVAATDKCIRRHLPWRKAAARYQAAAADLRKPILGSSDSPSTALVKALRDDLHAGRELLAPISDVYTWARGVRSRIEAEQPELLASFDQGADLAAQIVMIGLEQSVSRTQIIRFLEAKLQNLEQLIAQAGEYIVRVHQESDGSYWAEVLNLPGCFASGHTLDELREGLAEAISLHIPISLVVGQFGDYPAMCALTNPSRRVCFGLDLRS